MSDIPPWTGSEQLVIGLDLGTTMSAASIIHVVKNKIPKPRVVNRWPASPNSAKIPIVILYDQNGVPQFIGAEAMEDDALDRVESGELNLCKWFKLHLHPNNMAPPSYESLTAQSDSNDISATSPNATEASATPLEIPPLPRHVTVQKAYQDMITYMCKNAKELWITNCPDGEAIYNRLKKDIILIIAHPNGWSLHEQTVLRKAAKSAGFVRVVTDGGVEGAVERLLFVTESEASVHFGLVHSSSQYSGWLKADSCFAVVDAGGSTVDICVYKVTSMEPSLKLKEVKTSDCTQSGSIFVTRAFEVFIKNKLKNSRFGTSEFIKAIVKDFDTKTKIVFNKVEDTYVIRFGYDRDTDRPNSIFKGRLSISGAEIESCFLPCVDRIVNSIRSQIDNLTLTNILLVGGFGESPYLQRRLREIFELPTRKIITADEPSRKAVAEGLTYYYIKDTVMARATRFEFGVATARDWELFSSEAGNRYTFFSARGDKYINGGWCSIVRNGEVVESDQMLRRHFIVEQELDANLTHSVDLLTYNGTDGETDKGGWSVDVNGRLYDEFVKCCTLKAHLGKLMTSSPTLYNSATGKSFKSLKFDIGVFFGGTSLKACMIWKEDGREIRGPASVVPANFL